jgi:branched-chain amino acid transport system permease protein
VVVTYSETITFCLSLLLAGLVWWLLKKTDVGKSVRACAEDPEIATAFGINAKRLSIWLAGLCAGLAACAGVCVALMFTLAPSQIFTWVGVIFAAVMIGRLGSALTPLIGGLVIGVIESMTMALIAPTWAPLVAFMVLILILLLRRSDE